MPDIILERLEIEGFRTFTKKTIVALSTTPGLKMLGGENALEPRMGANGVGKSTLWEALYWCLYGTSIKGLRAGDLVSWQQKRPSVKAVISADDVQIEIQRIGNPDKLTVDGEAVSQQELVEFLGLNKACFAQSVLFGQGAPLLIDLPIPARAELLDDVLDLSAWAKASDVAGKCLRMAEMALQEAKVAKANADGRLSAIGDPAEIEAQANAWTLEFNRRVDEAIARVEQAEDEEKEIKNTVKEHQKLLDDEDSGALNMHKLSCMTLRNMVGDYEQDYRALMKELAQHEKAAKGEAAFCEACKRPFDTKGNQYHTKQVALAHIERLQNAIKDNTRKSNAERKRLDNAEAEYNILERKVQFRRDQLAGAKAELAAHARVIESLVNQAEQIANNSHNPYRERLEKMHADRVQAEADALGAMQEQLSCERDMQTAHYWRDAFKRVRLFLIKRVLAHLELEVANAAEAMGLGGWRIEFATETERKTGAIKQGIQIKITNPQGASGVWEAWSGGEGQRVRIAVAVGFGSMLQRMTGSNYTFEIWDEPSNWLSTEGIDDLMECLWHRADAYQKSIWVVDHRALAHSFAEIWQVRKDKNGASVQRLGA